jgi:hypothetical protein
MNGEVHIKRRSTSRKSTKVLHKKQENCEFNRTPPHCNEKRGRKEQNKKLIHYLIKTKPENKNYTDKTNEEIVSVPIEAITLLTPYDRPVIIILPNYGKQIILCSNCNRKPKELTN